PILAFFLGEARLNARQDPIVLAQRNLRVVLRTPQPKVLFEPVRRRCRLGRSQGQERKCGNRQARAHSFPTPMGTLGRTVPRTGRVVKGPGTITPKRDRKVTVYRTGLAGFDLQSPSAACTNASAATAAVSARRMRGPSARRTVFWRPSNAARSSGAKP